MTITTIITAVLLAVVVFFIIKVILIVKFKYDIENKLSFIRSEKPEEIKSIKFRWLSDASDKIYMLDNFVLPIEKDKKAKLIFSVNSKKEKKQKFDLILNKKQILNRECFSGYEYTNLGCSKNTACQNKELNEYVVDKSNKFVIHKCDGKNNILDSHTCYPDSFSKYNLPYACGDANVCFGKTDGHAQPNTGVSSTYSYLICLDDMLVEKECDKYREYFDIKKSRCVLAPLQCRQLEIGDSLILPDYTICYKKNDGSLNVQFFKPDENKEVGCHATGDCNEKLSHSSSVLTPKLWTSSQYYKKCVNGFWAIYFCNNDNNYFISQRKALVNEIQNLLQDGILYTLPSLDHISIFDEKQQTCVPFDYTKHYEKQHLPLLYTDPYMGFDSEVLPSFLYDYDSKPSNPSIVVDASSNFLKLNNNYNNYEEPKWNKELLYDENDKAFCSKNYEAYLNKNDLNHFLGVLTTAYTNVILSCRFGSPVNKMVIDKNEDPSLWNRVMLKDNKYKLSNGKTFKCKNNKTLHKFIPTCVEHRCTRADFVYPLNHPKSYPTLSVTYNGMFSFCSREGDNMNYENGPTIVKTSKLFKKLEKYCIDKRPGYWVHPYLNIPLNCNENKNVEIVNDRSLRDTKLETLTIEPDSIFKDDINALHLHFLRGGEGV